MLNFTLPKLSEFFILSTVIFGFSLRQLIEIKLFGVPEFLALLISLFIPHLITARWPLKLIFIVTLLLDVVKFFPRIFFWPIDLYLISFFCIFLNWKLKIINLEANWRFKFSRREIYSALMIIVSSWYFSRFANAFFSINCISVDNSCNYGFGYVYNYILFSLIENDSENTNLLSVFILSIAEYHLFLRKEVLS